MTKTMKSPTIWMKVIPPALQLGVTRLIISRPQTNGVNGGMNWLIRCSMIESYIISRTLMVI